MIDSDVRIEGRQCYVGTDNYLAGAAAVGLLLTGRQESLMEQSFSAITGALDFGNVLLPVLTASSAAAGQVTAAGAKYAAGSILAAATAIRNGVGVYGLVAVLGILLPPFLRTGAGFIVYRAAAALTGDLTPGRLSALARRGSDALGMLLGCLGACGLMLFFSIYAYMGVWTG